MDWITQERLAAQAGKQDKTPTARRVRKAKSLGLPDSEAIALPAASGKRVLVTQPWHGSKGRSGPCVSYSLDDPTPRLFSPSRESVHRERRTVTRVAVEPEVYKLRGIVGTHDLTGD